MKGKTRMTISISSKVAKLLKKQKDNKVNKNPRWTNGRGKFESRYSVIINNKVRRRKIF